MTPASQSGLLNALQMTVAHVIEGLGFVGGASIAGAGVSRETGTVRCRPIDRGHVAGNRVGANEPSHRREAERHSCGGTVRT